MEWAANPSPTAVHAMTDIYAAPLKTSAPGITNRYTAFRTTPTLDGRFSKSADPPYRE
jgi:hypothetical protein